MKIARFLYEDETYSGVLEDEWIRRVEGDIFKQLVFTGEKFLANKVTFLAPLIPNQIIGVGANYVSQTSELPKELPEIPVFFFKPVSSVIGPENEIILPKEIEQVKFESELAVIIGKEAKDITESQVQEHIFGYTISNDVTAPQFFREDGHWMVGKAFDTFTPLGPVIETELDIANLKVEAALNGVIKQDSPTTLMIITIEKMISYLSNVMTLQPGDVVLTGSPVGAEFIGEADVIECKINEIGVLRNKVVSVNKEVMTLV